jgi:predicted ribonuclease YlaK
MDRDVLLEYRPLETIPWVEVPGCSTVRLLIPLRVIEELDAKKYSGRPDLAKRARRILPQLEGLLRGTAAGQLTTDVTVGVPIDPGPRLRPGDADEEILATAREIGQLGGKTVTVVTGDTAMLIRSDALGLASVKLGEQYLRKPAQ